MNCGQCNWPIQSAPGQFGRPALDRLWWVCSTGRAATETPLDPPCPITFVIITFLAISMYLVPFDRVELLPLSIKVTVQGGIPTRRSHLFRWDCYLPDRTRPGTRMRLRSKQKPPSSPCCRMRRRMTATRIAGQLAAAVGGGLSSGGGRLEVSAQPTLHSSSSTSTHGNDLPWGHPSPSPNHPTFAHHHQHQRPM